MSAPLRGDSRRFGRVLVASSPRRRPHLRLRFTPDATSARFLISASPAKLAALASRLPGALTCEPRHLLHTSLRRLAVNRRSPTPEGYEHLGVGPPLRHLLPTLCAPFLALFPEPLQRFRTHLHRRTPRSAPHHVAPIKPHTHAVGSHLTRDTNGTEATVPARSFPAHRSGILQAQQSATRCPVRDWNSPRDWESRVGHARGAGRVTRPQCKTCGLTRSLLT